MMKCEKCEKLLVDYLYQELSAKQMIEVEKHLQGCRGCARTLESWQTIHAGYQKTAAKEEASPFLKQRIMMAAREQLTREPSWIQSALTVLNPVIVVPIILVSLLAVLFVQLSMPTRKMAMPLQKPQRISQISPQSREKRELSPEQEKNLKSLGYVSNDERGSAARRKSETDLAKVPTARDSFDLVDKYAKSERDQPEAPAPEPPAAMPEEAPPASAAAPASEANEEAMSRAESKQEQLGFGQKAAKVAGLTGQNDFQEAQRKFREDNLKEGYADAKNAVKEDRTGSLASEFHSAGIQFQENKDYDKAIVQFQLVADNYRDYTYLQDVLLRLAASHTELGQWEEARAVYLRILRLYPSNKEAQDRLNELNKKEKAQRQLQQLEAETKHQ